MLPLLPGPPARRGFFMNLIKTIEEAKAKSKKRNFVQSLDLIMNFVNIDFNKPDSRIDLEIALPAGRGKQIKVAAIAGNELVAEAKKTADKVITKEDIEALGADKKTLKKMVAEYDFFLCQTDLMALIGKTLGQVMGPRGKMPKPVPPTAKLGLLIERLKKTVKLKTKGKFLPTIHTTIGTEEMPNEDLAKNAETIIAVIKEKLPNKEGNIRSIYIKTTMGEPIKVDLNAK
jgi:large subunit ribosomal protein L1